MANATQGSSHGRHVRDQTVAVCRRESADSTQATSAARTPSSVARTPSSGTRTGTYVAPPTMSGRAQSARLACLPHGAIHGLVWMPVDNPQDRSSCPQANSYLTPRFTRFHSPLRVGCGEVVIPVCWGGPGATADQLLTRCVPRRPADTYIGASTHNPEVSRARFAAGESASNGKQRLALACSGATQPSAQKCPRIGPHSRGNPLSPPYGMIIAT